MPRPAFMPALALLWSLAFAAPSLAAWPNSTTSPLVISGGAGAQLTTSIAPDGSGGTFVAFALYSTNVDEYVQHLDAQGNPLWGSSGVALATGSSPTRGYPTVVADGAGGAIVSWGENFGVVGIRAQRVNAAGTPLWTAPGIRVATQTGDVFGYTCVGDGAGGAHFAWEYVFSSTDHDAYAQHVLPNGTLQFGAGALGVCTNASMQDMVVNVTDGAGGQWLLWRDNRISTSDALVQHVSSAGSLQFGAGGLAPETFVPGDLEGLTAVPDGYGGAIGAFSIKPGSDADIAVFHVYPDGTSTNLNASVYTGGDQLSPSLAADPDGGVFVAWTDYRSDAYGDVYVNHLTSFGSVSPGWNPNGNAVSADPTVGEESSRVVADGQGGAIVAWRQGNGGSTLHLIQATRLRTDGSRPPGWNGGGNPVMTKPVGNSSPLLAATAAGGAVVGWTTGAGLELDAVAQRIDAFGEVGTPEPHVAGVKDVPNDQGGSVRVSWDASPLDVGMRTDVQGYQLWRQIPAASALAALRTGSARLLGAATPAPTRDRAAVLLAVTSAAATTYWEYVGGLAAEKFAGYSMTAPTTGDSIGGSNPRTKFMVQAVGNWYAPGPSAAETWWNSAPDSGYSVDNLPPSLPAAFAAAWSVSSVTLHWNANAEPDLASYRLYRGSTPGFTPSPGNRIASPTQTWFDDPGAPPAWYKLSAVDIHGNESPFAVASTSGAADVAGNLPTELALAITSPNPAPERVSMRLDLPRAWPVDLAVFDAAGRRVRALRSGPQAAGRWPVTWSGAGENGSRVAPGLYVLRLQAAGRTLTRRVILLR